MDCISAREANAKQGAYGEDTAAVVGLQQLR